MIVLYTDEAELTDESREKLLGQGYVPIKVKSLNAVRFLLPPATPRDFDLITRAALTAIANWPGTRTTEGDFGLELAKLLLARRNEELADA